MAGSRGVWEDHRAGQLCQLSQQGLISTSRQTGAKARGEPSLPGHTRHPRDSGRSGGLWHSPFPSHGNHLTLQKVQVGLGKTDGQRTKTACCEDRVSPKATETLCVCPPVGTRDTGAEARGINVWVGDAESSGVDSTPGMFMPTH